MAVLSDCEKCMQSTTRLTRQAMACGYEPPAPPPMRAIAWTHDGYGGPQPSTCPGYTTRLPDVLEITRARYHWSKGNLAVFAPAPTDALLIGIEQLDVEIHRVEDWMIEQSRAAAKDA